jgi:4-hydroxybenzoate polyprenyltransferase
MIKLIRPLNLLIMAVTLILVRFCIFEPVFRQSGLTGLMPAWQFSLLVIATLFIGAAGYIINDVLDIELDKINKPGKQVIGKLISEERGKKLHFNLTAVGVAFGFVFAYLSGNVMLGIFFVIIPTALFYYSYKYKYLPAIGNLVVALLSAFVVLIYWVFEFYHLKSQPDIFVDASGYFNLLNRFVLTFAIFAFLVSLMREIVKDAQDMEGDARFGCRTLPIVLGIPMTRLIVNLLELITIGGIAWFQLMLKNSVFSLMAYLLLPTQVLLVVALAMTVTAKSRVTFGRLSLLFKLIMLTGMLSLLGIWFRTS